MVVYSRSETWWCVPGLEHGGVFKVWNMVMCSRSGTWSFFQGLEHGHVFKVWKLTEGSVCSTTVALGATCMRTEKIAEK